MAAVIDIKDGIRKVSVDSLDRRLIHHVYVIEIYDKRYRRKMNILSLGSNGGSRTVDGRRICHYVPSVSLSNVQAVQEIVLYTKRKSSSVH